MLSSQVSPGNSAAPSRYFCLGNDDTLPSERSAVARIKMTHDHFLLIDPNGTTVSTTISIVAYGVLLAVVGFARATKGALGTHKDNDNVE